MLLRMTHFNLPHYVHNLVYLYKKYIFFQLIQSCTDFTTLLRQQYYNAFFGHEFIPNLRII